VFIPDSRIAVTNITGKDGSFYVVRHANFRSDWPLSFNITLPTSWGYKTIPVYDSQQLTLSGRDSKIYVTDYPVGPANLTYCTAEIFTWQQYESRTVVILYGNADETHEVLIERDVKDKNDVDIVFSPGVHVNPDGQLLYARWMVSGTERLYLKAGKLHLYFVGKFSYLTALPPTPTEHLCLDRNAVYNYWVTKLKDYPPLIVNGPYLVRSASISEGNKLNIRADFNATTDVEIIGIPETITKVTINSADIDSHSINELGNWETTFAYSPPSIELPDLTKLDWRYIDSLPEIQPWYDDSAWPQANVTTNNTFRQPPLTPTSLYGSDYGFHSGALIFRGRFIAKGTETAFRIVTQGGTVFASSVWLNSTFVGSWPGKVDWNNNTAAHDDTYPIAGLRKGETYILTVVVDNMGLALNGLVGGDDMKQPRGIMAYNFVTWAGDGPEILWKVTGNLGGERYADKARGPLNEGGFYAERQGFHLPGPPRDEFLPGSPFQGIDKPGVAFYTAEFKLDLPSDKWDIPLNFEFPPIDSNLAGGYRALLFVNGWRKSLWPPICLVSFLLINRYFLLYK